MKLICSGILLAALALNISADDVSGTWKAKFTGSTIPRLSPEIVLDLKVEGDKPTGTAHMGTWPGDAPITDGKVEGNRVSFTAIGKRAWVANGASGYPKLDFVGTFSGKDAQFTVTWSSVMIYGSPDITSSLEMVGEKVSSQ